MDSDLIAGVKQLAASRWEYTRARQYYDGTTPEFFANIRMRRMMARTGNRFRFNFAHIPVDVVTDRVALRQLTSTDTAQDALLQAAWDDNALDRLYVKLIRDAGTYGDMYVIAWPDPVDDARVKISLNDPLCCRVIYSDEDPLQPDYAIKKWMMGRALYTPGMIAQIRAGQEPMPPQRVNLYYADRIEKYITLPADEGGYRDGTKETDWARFRDQDDDEWPMPNPYGRIPVFHFRNDEPYGSPEHSNAYGPQDAINKIVINHVATMDYAGFPIRAALAEADSDGAEFGDQDEDSFSFPTDTGATLPRDARSQLSADPGSLWYLRGIKELLQLDPVDPDTFLKPFDGYVRAMAQISEIPMHYFDPTGDAPSGESLKVAEAPLVKRANERQAWYGATTIDLAQFVLTLLGVASPTVALLWDPAESQSEAADVAVAGAKQAIGVGVEQTLIELGYEEDQISGWLRESGQDVQQRAEILAKIGAAAQALGAAVGFRVLSPEQVQTVIAHVLGIPVTDDLPQPQPVPPAFAQQQADGAPGDQEPDGEDPADNSTPAASAAA